MCTCGPTTAARNVVHGGATGNGLFAACDFAPGQHLADFRGRAHHPPGWDGWAVLPHTDAAPRDRRLRRPTPDTDGENHPRGSGNGPNAEFSIPRAAPAGYALRQGFEKAAASSLSCPALRCAELLGAALVFFCEQSRPMWP